MKKTVYIAPQTVLLKEEILTEGHLMAATVTGNTGEGSPGIGDGGGGDPSDFAKESFDFDDILEEFGYGWDEDEE